MDDGTLPTVTSSYCMYKAKARNNKKDSQIDTTQRDIKEISLTLMMQLEGLLLDMFSTTDWNCENRFGDFS